MIPFIHTFLRSFVLRSLTHKAVMMITISCLLILLGGASGGGSAFSASLLSYGGGTMVSWLPFRDAERVGSGGTGSTSGYLNCLLYTSDAADE